MQTEQGFQGLHADITQTIIKVFYQVANDLGFGFMESVYRRSMVIALQAAGLRAQAEVPIPVFYRGHCVRAFYADVVVEGLIVLELKATDSITKQFEAQLLHYLRATRMEVGLVLAFGEKALCRRVVMTNDRKSPHLNPS